ncbi:MAG TPA: hypothetical protein VKH63_21250 [Candidatus Acidoferrum sp.]|nr:hypothetical protein [Candidatus Acidoferrum sp.]
MANLIRSGIETALEELQETIIRIRTQLSPKDEMQTNLEELRAEAEKIEQLARAFREGSNHS